MNKVSIFGTVLVVTAVVAFPAMATSNQAMQQVAASGNAAKQTVSEGEVRKVDKDAGKLTIKHGPLLNLDLPPMTTVFHVKDKAILDRAKEGDQIRFVADKVGGAYTVIRIEMPM